MSPQQGSASLGRVLLTGALGCALAQQVDRGLHQDLLDLAGPPAKLVVAGHQERGIKQELRENLLARLADGTEIWTGPSGFEDTVLPQVERALIAAPDPPRSLRVRALLAGADLSFLSGNYVAARAFCHGVLALDDPGLAKDRWPVAFASFILGNLASAWGPSYGSLLLFRFIAGLPHGAYFGVAALTAVAISPPERRGRAVSLVMLGLTLAILIGNPLATWAGQVLDWRWIYAAVAIIAVTTVALLAMWLPAHVDGPKTKPLDELRAFNRLPVWQALAIGAIGFAGMFAVFSYLAPTMLEVTGVSAAWIPVGLAGFGLGGVIGNFAGGWLYDRYKLRGAWVVLVSAIVALLAFPWMAQSLPTILLATVAIGLMGALGPILQSHLMDVAGDAQTLAAASHHAAFNTANALGPWLGGMAITAGFGWTSTGYVGAATAVVGLMIYVWASRTHPAARADDEMLVDALPCES